MGFDPKEVANAEVTEKTAGQLGEEYGSLVENCIAQSGGMLPAQDRADMLFFNITATHTTATFRIAEYGAIGIHPEICDEHGMVSKSKIIEERPSYGPPINNGMEHLVFKREICELVPEMAPFLSKADNVTHGIHRKQTSVQTLRQLANKIQLMKEMENKVVSYSMDHFLFYF